MNTGEFVALALRMVVSLALVLGLLVWLARYASRRGLGGAATAGYDIEVLARRSLSRSASVQVVRIGEETFVLGVGDSGVTVLSQVPAAEEEEEVFDPSGSHTVSDIQQRAATPNVQDTTGGAGPVYATDPRDVVRLAGHQEGAVGSALRMLDEMLRPEGRHRATRGARRRR